MSTCGVLNKCQIKLLTKYSRKKSREGIILKKNVRRY